MDADTKKEFDKINSLLKGFAKKEDLEGFAKKEDLEVVKGDIRKIWEVLEGMAGQLNQMYNHYVLSSPQFIDMQDKVHDHEGRIVMLERKAA
ncbi:MAG: hypothetical protein ABH856_01615 [Patescibacteria group bacterium]|nr:hypothetical protein [Patescibacteria group bacterium]